MHALGCLLLLILIPLICIIVIVANFVSLLFGRRPKVQFHWTNNRGAHQQSNNSYSNSQSSGVSSADSKQQKKIFDKSEGEYVDFEEV